MHTHVFDPEQHFGPQLRADLARCGVDPQTWNPVAQRHLETTRAADVAVVFGIQAAATGWNVPNAYVLEHVRRAPDRLIFFASIDPGLPGFEEELERWHQDFKCQGIKIAPIYQGVHPLDPRYRVLFAYCQKHGLPVLTHMATTFSSGVPLEYARPAHMDQVAIDFPDLKIILAHLGHPWEGETIAVIRRNANVYADLSALHYRPWQFYNSMRLAYEYRATHKLFFGSDFPFTTTAGSLEGIQNLNAILAGSGLPPVPAEVIAGVLQADVLQCLGLNDPRRGHR
ncbi:MAG: amidohydrolase [Verrucomicrobiae bacterium]|nr:amidohydrolase [Verrucomicrobiae bacterium]